MNLEISHVLATAPILYFGIWLVAQESLVGSERFATLLNRGKESSRIKVGERIKIPAPKKLDDIILSASILGLVFLALIFLALKYAKAPFLVTISILAFAALVQQKKMKNQELSWQRNLDAELPGLTQMLTLMISSGISPLRAIELISTRTESFLAAELRLVIDQVRLGNSSSQALDCFAKRVNTLDSRRLSNAISMALERGSPLTPVLTALVSDSRNEEKLRLLRQAGKSEIALMIPVVFLLLPISVLFALFPSFTSLQMF
jgi:tight adherence protein C